MRWRTTNSDGLEVGRPEASRLCVGKGGVGEEDDRDGRVCGPMVAGRGEVDGQWRRAGRGRGGGVRGAVREAAERRSGGAAAAAAAEVRRGRQSRCGRRWPLEQRARRGRQGRGGQRSLRQGGAGAAGLADLPRRPLTAPRPGPQVGRRPRPRRGHAGAACAHVRGWGPRAARSRATTTCSSSCWWATATWARARSWRACRTARPSPRTPTATVSAAATRLPDAEPEADRAPRLSVGFPEAGAQRSRGVAREPPVRPRSRACVTVCQAHVTPRLSGAGGPPEARSAPSAGVCVAVAKRPATAVVAWGTAAGRRLQRSFERPPIYVLA